MTEPRPYAETAWLYRQAGWSGVLPLPAGQKGPPPAGFTGWAGVDPDPTEIEDWVDGPAGAGNIALRLPEGVYGLDVDAYGTKTGGEAFRAAEANLGPLPPTWLVTSRDDGISGIRLFRASLPAGRRWKDEPAGHGAGIEALHFGHRYAVVFPSLHPETGATYLWWWESPTARASAPEIPRVDELPWLPATWIEALSEPGEVATGEQASHVDTVTAVTGFRDGDLCDRTRDAHGRGLARLREARDGAALHPAGRDATHELVRLGHEGHSGARRALAEHFAAFAEVRTGARHEDRRAAEAEWWRLVRGAVGKLAGQPREACDCALMAGEGVQFDAPLALGPAVGDDPEEEGGEGGAGGLVEKLEARLLSAAQMRDVPPPEPLVAGMLSLDSESWLIARSGSFKTFVALDIAGHIGGGKPWAGRTVRQGEVIYLVAEGAGGMGMRVRAWEQRNGEMEGVHFLPLPIQVKREDHWAALVELVRRRRPVMVVLDTQARISVGLNENDNSEMGELIEAIGRLRRAAGSCVLVVHHLGRNGQDARGASAIDGAQDSELRLTKTADRRVVLETDKQRNLPDDVRVELELFDCVLDGGGTSLVVGAPLSSVPPDPDWRANLTLNQAVLVDVMRDIFPMVGATKAELKAEVLRRPRRQPDGTAEAPMNASSFRRAWDALVDQERFARVHATQRYVLPNIDPGVSE